MRGLTLFPPFFPNELAKYNGYIHFFVMYTNNPPNNEFEDLYSDPNTVTANNWQYLAVTRDGYDLIMYRNGGIVTNFTLQRDNTHFPTPAMPLRIGHMWRQYAVPIRHFDGSIDEVRIADTARSPAWIATEYNNQNSPSAFAGSSGEELFVPKGTVIFIY